MLPSVYLQQRAAGVAQRQERQCMHEVRQRNKPPPVSERAARTPSFLTATSWASR
jgi:hypothetical protein